LQLWRLGYVGEVEDGFQEAMVGSLKKTGI
jgi:hypothetical protein